MLDSSDVLGGEQLVRFSPSGEKLRLLLHCCCAPCASHVLEQLVPLYRVTVLFYNPNIEPREEYDRRAAEFSKLPMLDENTGSVDLLWSYYDTERFTAAVAGFEDQTEGGERCRACFKLRLARTAELARDMGFDVFATTLSVSPHKDAVALNEIGCTLAGEYGVEFLSADFKKRDGYKRSIELSKQYGLYRQNY